MLVASIFMMLSVVVPHHHHSNGMPCFMELTAETHDHNSPSSSHDCGCNGHNLALFTSLLSHASDLDVSHLLFPLQVLFDYINPPEPIFCGQSFDRGRAFYIESLHDSWIVCASGLRAPPVL